MSGLPPGFILDQPAQDQAAPSGLPQGFSVDVPASSGVTTVPAANGRPTKVIMDMGAKPKTFTEKLADTWPARAIESIYSAMTLPGDVMAGKAHVPGSPEAQAIPGAVPMGSPDSSGERIADLATMGNPMSAARGTGAAVAREAGLGLEKSAAPSIPTIAEAKAAAKAGYESDAVKNLQVDPKSVADFTTGLKSRLNELGVNDILAPKTFGILDQVESVPSNAIMTGQNLRTLQKTLGKASQSPDPQERLAATKALIDFNKHLENLPSAHVVSGDAGEFSRTVARANANYSAAKTAENLDKKMVSAQLRANSTNSGMNVANAIRQNMRQVVTRPKEARGLTPAELKMATGIVEGTRTQNALRAGGNLLGGGGGLGSVVTAAIGGSISPALAALPVAGYAMKALGNKMTVRQAERLSEAVRARAPVASSLTKYEEKALAFERSKNAKTYSDLAIASRNLKNNLAAIGISASVGDLVRHSSQSQ
jgi:hypothetical protein